MSRFPLRACTVAVIAASLTGCQYLGSKFTDEKIQYESTTSRAPLEIPPDLSQLPMDDRFTVPGKTQTVTATQVAETEQARKNASGAAVENGTAPVLPATVVTKIVKDGSERYIQVNLPPEQVWESLLDFWPSVGLQVEREDPRAGVMETNWAENKANLPQDIIRATLGKLLDSVYSTGELVSNAMQTAVRIFTSRTAAWLKSIPAPAKSTPPGSRLRLTKSSKLKC